MRGSDARSGSLFSYVDLESRVRSDHPLRAIRTIINEALATLSSDLEAIYAAGIGRPSIPPERLLRALLLQAFYGIRSERQILERLDYDLLFRGFVGLGVDDAVWDQTTFGKNRDRLLAGDVAHKFLAAVLAHPKVKRLLSSEHFSVDGTLIEAWASMKSVKPKSLSSGTDPRNGSGEPPAPGRNRESNFHGQRRTNDTHQSTTDPDARLYRKGVGREAKLGFVGGAGLRLRQAQLGGEAGGGHALMENRNGLVVDACLTRADSRRACPSSWRATTTSFRPIGTSTRRTPIPGTPFCSLSRARRTGDYSIKAGRTRCGRCIPMCPCSRSRTTSASAGLETPDSASTTCSSART